MSHAYESGTVLSFFGLCVIGEGLLVSWGIKTSWSRGLGAITHRISLTFVQVL